MSKRYIPFDRYNWDLKSLFLEYKIQSVLNPEDYATTREEVDWYINAITDAQNRYNSYHSKWDRRIIFGPIIVYILVAIIVGVIIGWFHIIMSFSTYLICLMVGFYITLLWGWIASKSKFADKFLARHFREMFYPSVLPNVERFLSYCFMEKFGES